MNLTTEDLIRHCWATGNLAYKIRHYQEEVYNALWEAIQNPEKLKYLLNISRRFGKTHIVSIVAVEYAIRNPNSIINYAAPTDKEMNKILQSIMPTIFEDCPRDLKPKRAKGVWSFSNGSVIHTAGVNNQHADDLRGSSAHLNIVDEAGMVDELNYLVSSVLMPQQLTTDGTMLILSTPPRDIDHDYVAIYHECRERGDLKEFTIYDNKSLNDLKLKRYMEEAGGENSSNWRREYLVQFVNDETKTVVEEWDAKYVQTLPRDEYYKYYHKYTAMDTGFKDNNVCLFGYYDFRRAAIVFQRELVYKENTWDSELLARETKRIEKELWNEQTPLRRIADNNNLIILNDLQRIYQLPFIPVSKDKLHAMVNEFKVWVKTGRVIVDPSCDYLIKCLSFARWNKAHDAFAQSKMYQHYDALAAAIYMIRAIDIHTNPIPVTHKVDPYNDTFPTDFKLVATGESSSVQNMRNYMNSRTNYRGN